MLFATSLADCTKCRFATGLFVLDDARRHVLHREDVCFATIVAADSTCEQQSDAQHRHDQNAKRVNRDCKLTSNKRTNVVFLLWHPRNPASLIGAGFAVT